PWNQGSALGPREGGLQARRRPRAALAAPRERAVHAPARSRASDGLPRFPPRGTQVHVGLSSARRSLLRHPATKEARDPARVAHRGSVRGPLPRGPRRPDAEALGRPPDRLLLDRG